jgi:hypothetical protein
MCKRACLLAMFFVVSAFSQTTDKQAREVSDAFMRDIAAGRTEAAIERWHKAGAEQFEQQFLETTAASSIRSNVENCGRPAAVTPLQDGKPEVGELVTQDRKIKQLIFLYRVRTPRGLRRFDVTVEAGETGEYHVAGLGCGILKE